MAQPRFRRDPSIAACGMLFHKGDPFPGWRGDIPVGSLKHDMIPRPERAGDEVRVAERPFQGACTRIRDIAGAPVGVIGLPSGGGGAARRTTPGQGG